MKNTTYSHKAFPYHGLDLTEVDAGEFNNTEIVGSCFYQEYRDGDAAVVKDVFPSGITGVKFIGCNLDNVFVPPGNVMVDCNNRIIKHGTGNGVDYTFTAGMLQSTPVSSLTPSDAKVVASNIARG